MKGWGALPLWAWIAAAFAALYAVHLGFPELTPVDEARSGVIVRSCLEGDALLPRTPDGHLTEKPPLYYWIGAGASRVIGEGEWALRGVSVLFALGTLLVVGWTASRVFPRPGAPLAVAVLGCNVLFAAWARLAMVDMTFTFFLTAGLSAYLLARVGKLEAWTAAGLCGIAWGLAVLTKGPLGLAIPALAVLVDAIVVTRGRITRVSHFALPASVSLLVVLEIATLWYLPATLAGRREFLFTSVLDENLFMPLGLKHGIAGSHTKPYFYYPLRQVLALLPVAALLPEAIRRALNREGGSPVGVLLTWFGAGVMLLVAASNKRFYYLLPLQPMLAIGIAGCLVRAWSSESTSLLRWSVRGAGAIVGFAALVIAVLAYAPFDARGQDGALLEQMHRNQGRLVAAGIAISWAGFFMAGTSFASGRAMIRSTLIAGFLAAGLHSFVIDPIQGREDRIRPFAEEMAQHMSREDCVALWPPEFGYAFDYYWPGVKRGEGPSSTARFLIVREDLISELPFSVETLGLIHFSSGQRRIAFVRRQ